MQVLKPLQSLCSAVQQACRQPWGQLNHHLSTHSRFFSPMTVLTKTSSLGLSLQPSPVVNQVRNASLLYMHKHGPHQKTCTKRKPLDGQPFMKGVVLKTLIKKPKKPNSANRKCVLVRLTNGKELVAYVPGEGHNLQEHNIVLTRVGRLQDVPGVKIKCVRGKYDLQHVIKKK